MKLNIIGKEIQRNSKKLLEFHNELEEINKRFITIKDNKYLNSLCLEAKILKEMINENKRNNSLSMTDQKRYYKELNTFHNNDVYGDEEAVKKIKKKLKEAEEINCTFINKIEQFKNEIYELTEQYTKLQREYKTNKKIAVKEGVYLFDSEHRYYLLSLKSTKLEKSNEILKKKQQYQAAKILNEINSLKFKNSNIQKKILENENWIKEQNKIFCENSQEKKPKKQNLLLDEDDFNLNEELKKIFETNKNKNEVALGISTMILSPPGTKTKKEPEDLYLTSSPYDEKKNSNAIVVTSPDPNEKSLQVGLIKFESQKKIMLKNENNFKSENSLTNDLKNEKEKNIDEISGYEANLNTEKFNQKKMSLERDLNNFETFETIKSQNGNSIKTKKDEIEKVIDSIQKEMQKSKEFEIIQNTSHFEEEHEENVQNQFLEEIKEKENDFDFEYEKNLKNESIKIKKENDFEEKEGKKDFKEEGIFNSLITTDRNIEENYSKEMNNTKETSIKNSELKKNNKNSRKNSKINENNNEENLNNDDLIKNEEVIGIKSRRINMKKLNEKKKNDEDFLFCLIKSQVPTKKEEENTITFNLFSKKTPNNFETFDSQKNTLKNNFERKRIIFDNNEEDGFKIMEIPLKNSTENLDLITLTTKNKELVEKKERKVESECKKTILIPQLMMNNSQIQVNFFLDNFHFNLTLKNKKPVMNQSENYFSDFDF